ncbi:hypothetical protein PUN28_016337 [Cardiocondyla obscurior]|uniref:Uncharacterized protein n=1 Tax=Cardiocondyla obscurior TaxID=286306 RepID=A0AAW2EVY0_9HYME
MGNLFAVSSISFSSSVLPHSFSIATISLILQTSISSGFLRNKDSSSISQSSVLRCLLFCSKSIISSRSPSSCSSSHILIAHKRSCFFFISLTLSFSIAM